MRFNVGQKVRVKEVFSGGNFCEGDIVFIEQIGNEDEQDCYGAISPYDGLLWYLREEEVCPVTNADCIRAMSDKELSKLLCCTGWQMSEYEECLKWLQQPAKEER